MPIWVYLWTKLFYNRQYKWSSHIVSINSWPIKIRIRSSWGNGISHCLPWRYHNSPQSDLNLYYTPQPPYKVSELFIPPIPTKIFARFGAFSTDFWIDACSPFPNFLHLQTSCDTVCMKRIHLSAGRNNEKIVMVSTSAFDQLRWIKLDNSYQHRLTVWNPEFCWSGTWNVSRYCMELFSKFPKFPGPLGFFF